MQYSTEQTLANSRCIRNKLVACIAFAVITSWVVGADPISTDILKTFINI